MRLMIFVALAPGSATALEVNSNRLQSLPALLDHASVQTTERYIRCKQNLREAVNIDFQISFAMTA